MAAEDATASGGSGGARRRPSSSRTRRRWTVVRGDRSAYPATEEVSPGSAPTPAEVRTTRAGGDILRGPRAPRSSRESMLAWARATRSRIVATASSTTISPNVGGSLRYAPAAARSPSRDSSSLPGGGQKKETKKKKKGGTGAKKELVTLSLVETKCESCPAPTGQRYRVLFRSSACRRICHRPDPRVAGLRSPGRCVSHAGVGRRRTRRATSCPAPRFTRAAGASSARS